MQDYYFLKNVQKNEITFYKEHEFLVVFGGAFEHILSNFVVRMYVEKQIEIPHEKKQTIFFMDFITNWNENKQQWSDLEAVSYYDLTDAEKEQLSNLIDNEEQQEKERNQNNKSVGNGERFILL